MQRENAHFYAIILSPFLAAIGLEISKPAIAYFSRYTLMSTGADVGLIMTGFMLGRTIGSFISGKIKLKKLEKLSVACLILSSLTMSLLIFAYSIWLVIALRLVHGLLAGLTWPTLQSAVSKKTALNKRSTILGIYFFGGGIGRGMGNGIYTMLNPSYQQAILLSALFYLLSIIPIIPFSKYPYLEPKKVTEKEGKAVFSATALVFISAFSIGYVLGGLGEVFIIYLKEAFLLGKTEVTTLLFYAYILGTVLGLLLGKLADKYGERKIIIAGNSILAIACTILIFRVPQVLLVIAGSILATTYRGLLPIVRGLAAKVGGDVSELLGISNMASSIGGMISPYVIGLFLDIFGTGGEVIILGGFGFIIALIPILSTIFIACMWRIG